MPEDRFYSPDIIRKNKKTRERVDDLRKSDGPEDDSVYDLAKAEDKFREEYRRDNLLEDCLEKYADKFTTLNLEKFEAQKSNWIDGLTGLRNKKALYGEMPCLLGLAKRNNHDCSVLMIDMDFFKKVNDEFGHLAGDQTLKVVADIIRSSVRESDLLYRFGGEEFVVALYDTDSRLSQMIAEKIRKNVEKAGIVVLDEQDNQQAFKKTISIGCVGTDQIKEWESTTEDNIDDILEGLIRRADISLYRAKNTGRNKTVLYEPGNDKIIIDQA